MKVLHVTTGTGQSVTMRFADGHVAVHEVSPARPRAVRACAGGLLIGFGLAAVAVNAGDRGITGLDVALWIAVALTVVAAVGGAIWWFLIERSDRRRPPEVITASSVVNARSTADVTVTLELADGSERSYSAVGHAGTLLSTGFSRLLAVAGEAGAGPVADPRSTI
ncbi:hypothetical protein [Paractinoplanes maris]|uniref:hypothetical protein n=1 Tax=Paractinoplanes maris TaxID=1734446 RepID=UPI0020213C33|nr:hypothetical protein [Actinoplanes maris]